MRKISNKNILVTGGLGFIGLNFINKIIKKNYKNVNIINIDKKTSVANKNIEIISSNNIKYTFLKIDISKKKQIDNLFKRFSINIIINFAAESHVDTSITNSSKFIKTNINGTYNLLNAAYNQWMLKPFIFKKKYKKSIFFQISTDEVYGSIKGNKNISEKGKFFPSSPYSASKASAENLVFSYNKTYGLNTLISNSSNNYGQYQNYEKFIPKTIQSIILNKKIKLYGDGKNIRDWIYVEDNCDALITILKFGNFGESYNISANIQKENIQIINTLINIAKKKLKKNKKYLLNLIDYVEDRPGHDFRYGIDSSKLELLGWKPKYNLNKGLEKTFNWYLKVNEKIVKK